MWSLFVAQSLFATMYLDISWLHQNGHTYQRVLLRESYREQGKVKKHTIANLSACSEKEIAAIKLALRHKSDLSELASVTEDLTLRQGPSIGAVWLVYQIASRLGISAALGNSRQGKLALWQVIARVIDQGSRLSAVRFASNHGACDVLDLETFHEEHLYANLDWLHKNQEEIENKLARKLHDRYKDLALVEWAFRTSKTVELEMRPVNVRLESHTRAHAFVVMMAYWIVKELSSLWAALDVTVAEGLKELDALCSTEVSIADGGCFHRIPEPRELSQQLLEAANVKLPMALPSKGIIVATKKKTPVQAKSCLSSSA